MSAILEFKDVSFSYTTNGGKKLNIRVHSLYNEDGDSFEELLTVGISKANLKQIFTAFDTSEEKECLNENL